MRECYGVASLEVSGSVARGDHQRDSDVDLLHVLKPDARLSFNLFELEGELARPPNEASAGDLVGRSLDVGIPRFDDIR